MYRMLLRSVGNPDLRQNPGCPVSPAEVIELTALDTAGEVLRSYVERHGLGCGNLPHTGVFEGNCEVARVSYNGRIWLAPKDGWNDRIQRTGSAGGNCAPMSDDQVYARPRTYSRGIRIWM